MFNMAKVKWPDGLEGKGFWTKDGRKIPRSDFKAPPGANDFEITLAITWTRNGRRIGEPELPPRGANDVSIELTPPPPPKQRRARAKKK